MKDKMDTDPNFKRLDLSGYVFTVSSDGLYIFDECSKTRRALCSCKRGYLRVWSSGFIKKRRSFLVHRLVALAWLECPNGYERLDVNHKDANKSNNRWSNLEWVSHQENMNHGKKLKLFKAGPGRRSKHCGHTKET